VTIKWVMDLPFDRLVEASDERVEVALMKALQHLRAVIDPDIPFREGHLQGSADLTVAGDTGTILYPGPYALYQHEGVYYRHGVTGAPLKYGNGRQPFYLSRPMLQEEPTILGIIEHELFGDQ
jgi:hypothetical protein